MAFDKETRNLLAKTVAACRRRLAGDITDQLRGVFGLHPEGVVLPLEKLTHLSPDQHAAARRLRDLLEHYTAGAAGKDSDRRKAAYERMVLEISFTALNRLAALRLCEERGLVVECVRKGTTSAGFQMFERISGWLRAQKTWKNIGIKAAERPRIVRSNIVTAEPMPSEEDMRCGFTAGLKPRVLGQIVDEVFEKMKLAGEAGSLLKIEEEIKHAVAAAKKQCEHMPPAEQLLLFPGTAPRRHPARNDFSDLKKPQPTAHRPPATDSLPTAYRLLPTDFWQQAEDRILDALKEYAERVENGHATRRRLFAEDAARGFAFIDLCRKRYDVVLMNPPFGEPAKISKSLIEKSFPRTKNDVYAAFVERGLNLLRKGGRGRRKIIRRLSKGGNNEN